MGWFVTGAWLIACASSWWWGYSAGEGNALYAHISEIYQLRHRLHLAGELTGFVEQPSDTADEADYERRLRASHLAVAVAKKRRDEARIRMERVYLQSRSSGAYMTPNIVTAKRASRKAPSTIMLPAQGEGIFFRSSWISNRGNSSANG